MLTLPRTALLCLLAACAAPDGESTLAVASLLPERTDSGGVTILTHAAGALDRAPRVVLDTAPLAEITGSAEDIEADISTIRPVLFLRDGRLVGIDQQRQVIVVFAADGSTRQEFGRQGAGPGEYGRVNSIVPGSGDTLLVADYMNNRVSLLDPDLGPLAEFPLSAPQAAGGNSPIGMAGHQMLLHGTNFSSGSTAPPGIKGVLFDPVSGVARRTFTTGPEERPEDAPRQITTSSGAVLVARAISIPALTAFPRAFAWNGETVIADGNRFRFEWWDTAGTTLRQLRVERQREPVTAAIWEAYVSGAIARASGASSPLGSGGTAFFISGGGSPDTATMRRSMASQPHADSLPLFERTQLGPAGTLWVVDYPVPGRTGWGATAFGADGRILGRIVADSGDAPLVFGDDRALFRSEDELGIATFSIRKFIFPD